MKSLPQQTVEDGVDGEIHQGVFEAPLSTVTQTFAQRCGFDLSWCDEQYNKIKMSHGVFLNHHNMPVIDQIKLECKLDTQTNY